MKNIFKLIYSVLVSALLIFAINVLGGATGLYLPFNYITVGMSAILGFPGFGLVVLITMMYR